MLKNFEKRFEHFFQTIAAASSRRPLVFVGIGLALCALSLYLLSQMPFLTSRTALLDRTSPEVERFEHYMENFGAASDLIIAIEGIERPELEKYAAELASRLEELPEVSAADSRLDLNFFVSHAYTILPHEQFDKAATFMDGLLSMDGKMPSSLDEALDAANRYFEEPPAIPMGEIDMDSARASLNGMQFFLDEWLRWLEPDSKATRIAWEKMLADQPEARKMVTGNGFYDSHDGSMLFVFVRKAIGSEEFTAIKPFYENVRSTNDALKAEWKAAGRAVPTTGLAGMPATIYEEFSYIQKGVTWTIAGAGILILLIITFVMRSFRRGLVVFGAMGFGSVWAFSMMYFTVGHMNMVTTAFTAVLFGLGVDYGVFISSRIIEEMKRGLPLMDSIRVGTGASARPVVTSGLASMMVFGALGTVEFTGFSELGIVALCGVATVQISTFTLLPALFALLKPRPAEALGQDTGMEGKDDPGKRIPKPIAAAIVTVAVILAAVGAYKGINLPFDYDVLNMLPADSETAIYSKRMVKESDYQSEVVILVAKTQEEAREIGAKAQKLNTVAKVQSPMQFFPSDAAERVEPARKVGRILSESDVARYIMDEKNFVLPENGAPLRIAAILEKVMDMIDDYQESASSAGHADLVGAIDGVRDRLARIIERLQADPEKAGTANQAFLTAIVGDARYMLRELAKWKDAKVLEPTDLPDNLRSRFFGNDGSIATYVYPADSVYNISFLQRLMKDIYEINPAATGFPTTHNVQAELARSSFFSGTALAIIVAMAFLMLVLRSIPVFLVASLPLLIGEGIMLGILAILNKTHGYMYNYANIIALPLLMALALDYGIWFAHRFDEMRQYGPWQIIRVAGIPILVAALTTIAGIGALSLAEYRGISTLGLGVTIGLACCLACALLLAPLMAQLTDRRKK